MYAHLIRAIKWNTAGIILYKIILFTHQSFLFAFIPQTEYGILGTIFSTIYFLIPVTNFGFDYTLLSFFKKNRSPEETNFILKQYTYRVLTLLAVLGILSACFFYVDFIQTKIPLLLFVTSLALFFIESLKHSLLTYAHILHLNKKIALYENVSLVAYVVIVWAYILLYKTTSFSLFILPLAITSALETAFIGHALVSAYKELPQSAPKDTPTTRSFYHESFFNYINQLAKALFSPNFLIILLAATVGFHKTGYIKFVTTLIIFLYNIFNRSIQMSGGALLSSISHMPTTLIKKTFNTITNYYTQTLLIIAIYFSGLVYFYSQTRSIAESSNHLSVHALIILFCLISFIEYGTLTYETLFITQKYGRELAFINGINITGAVLIVLLSCFYPHPIFLLFLCVLKIGTVGYTIYRAHQIWNVSVDFSINATTIIIHLALALSLTNYFL